MNTEIKRDWTDTKGRIKTRFGKLSDQNIETAKDNLDALTGQIQSVYGYPKDQAEKEFLSFKASLDVKAEPEAARKMA